jgi:hypothetical protein
LELCESCLCTFLHYSAIKDFSKHPCIDAKRISLSPLFSATALLLTDSNPPKKTTTTEYIKEAGLQLVRDAVVRALPAVLVEQVESLSIYLASSANARLKHGAAIDGALVSLLSDFALSQREEMLTEAETGACVPFFPVLPFADPTLASLSRQPREPGRSRDFELQRHVSCS